MRATMLTALLFTFIGCGGLDDEAMSHDPSEIAAAAVTAHLTQLRPAPNAGGCGALPDMIVPAPSCTGFPTSLQGPGGECSAACWSDSSGVRLSVGCRACSTTYSVSFR